MFATDKRENGEKAVNSHRMKWLAVVLLGSMGAGLAVGQPAADGAKLEALIRAANAEIEVVAYLSHPRPINQRFTHKAKNPNAASLAIRSALTREDRKIQGEDPGTVIIRDPSALPS